MIACSRKSPPPLPPGMLGGGALERGHRLRTPAFAPAAEELRIPVLIVGAGIAGLSAAWRLDRAGHRDFLLLDLEDAVGGNARHGENDICRYPLGAHYLPLPTAEATAVRHLLADLGALEGDPLAERPRYDERLLCHTPQERVFHNGVWQDGVFPQLGLAAADRRQWHEFQGRMRQFRDARDARGRRAFALPVALASRDARWTGFDHMTMAEWLVAEGFDSLPLHWYVNYACRDDFGTDYRQTSAWAGIHYFACRNGQAANAAADAVLTAPEGNGWIVTRLAERFRQQTRTAALCHRLTQANGKVIAEVAQDGATGSLRIIAEQAIWAAPPFVLPHVAPELPPALAGLARAGDHAPWLVANLSLAELPSAAPGAPLSWDNVIYDAPGLGYVVATHQQVRLAPSATVFTYYRALTGQPASAARELLLQTSREAWAAAILDELGGAHPDLPLLVNRLDVHRHGHAMLRPLPGVVLDPARRALTAGWLNVELAHADISGMSLFEEANYHGVRAAEAVLARLGVRTPTLLT
jgi:hypothetical protein